MKDAERDFNLRLTCLLTGDEIEEKSVRVLPPQSLRPASRGIRAHGGVDIAADEPTVTDARRIPSAELLAHHIHRLPLGRQRAARVDAHVDGSSGLNWPRLGGTLLGGVQDLGDRWDHRPLYLPGLRHHVVPPVRRLPQVREGRRDTDRDALPLP